MSGDLDGFFARCDDVLDNWDGSDDAMHGQAPKPGTEQELALRGDSYYDQCGASVTWFAAEPVMLTPAQIRALLDSATEFAAEFGRLMQGLARALNTIAPTLTELAAALHVEGDEPVDVYERAMQRRRTRNTGPDNQYRLDGTHR